MTLNLAHNFLLLSVVNRASVLKELRALDENEVISLFKGNHRMDLYRLAFTRLKERNQINALERAILNYL